MLHGVNGNLIKFEIVVFLRVRSAGNLADFDVPHPDGGIASEAKLEAGGVAVAGAEVDVHWYKRVVMLIWKQGK